LTVISQCVVLGGGGHAKVLIECLLAGGTAKPIGVVDNDPIKRDGDVGGVKVMGDDSVLPGLRAQGITHFAVGVGSTGDNTIRRRLYDQAIVAGLIPVTAIHPSAIVSPSAVIGRGCQIFAGAIVQTSARLGDNIIVNTGAIVEHDCLIGDQVHIATGARLGGEVNVAENAHIGIGATVLQTVSIGAGAIVAAGATVITDVPPNMKVGGVPATNLHKE
jgi:UDP-perosamine 4-acetyltransferase